MKQHQKPIIKQEVVDSINATLSQNIRDAGLRATGGHLDQTIDARSGYDKVTIVNPYDEADKPMPSKVVLQADFLKISFKETFPYRISIYDMTGYDPMLVDSFSKLFRVLQRGSMLFSYQWATTESYQDDNPEHVEIVNGIKTTFGLTRLRSYSEISKVAEKVGFEVVDDKWKGNLVNSLGKPWLERLKERRSGYRKEYIAVMVLEKLGFVTKSTVDDRKMRLKTVDYLIKGGETGIFSPMHMTLCRKPGKPLQPYRKLM